MSEITFKDAGEATAFLFEREVCLRDLASKTRPALIGLYAYYGGLTPIADLRRWVKADLVTAIVEMQFSPDTVTLANHIRYQASGVQCSDACPHHEVDPHVSACPACGKPGRWSVDDDWSHETYQDAIACQHEGCSDACSHHEVAGDFPHPTAEEHAIAQVAERLDRFCADLEEQGMIVHRDGFSVRIDIPGSGQHEHDDYHACPHHEPKCVYCEAPEGAVALVPSALVPDGTVYPGVQLKCENARACGLRIHQAFHGEVASPECEHCEWSLKPLAGSVVTREPMGIAEVAHLRLHDLASPCTVCSGSIRHTPDECDSLNTALAGLADHAGDAIAKILEA